ncbi:uncharacterized protein RHIMIDRAFT_220394 [Rhizopus microsporus ATCC 52813]|uniref:C2H2-type domain-containing protein n=1 Tax=Rhizopus microsporus ATCC 52813 TaxID=1340429 RepID=A0A2G4SG86_RHIZD|nr:uncharacterized protein RHIMIDRAFT_220394 [Rhizopus microsporus ATCC 52813]PHZ07775.1 hypothetical protein RHIMIDRAFT_220394 [Rhizopus microsporus ATCC 52813]
MCNNDLVLSIKDASGRHVSLLNDNTPTNYKMNSLNSANTTITVRRKYHCTEPGCNKSFTTSGHLARHNRIHTGEKNFHCLHPGCPSRFSRQDNMMQHYRTHLSQKARRQQQLKKSIPKTPYCHSVQEPKYTQTRPRRAITMPSLPYPPFDLKQDRLISRPRRTLSTSSTCSSTSSFTCSSCPSPQFNHILPPPTFYTIPPPPQPNHYLHYRHQPVELAKLPHLQKPEQQQQQSHWESKTSEKPLSSLLHLANIVSTFG